VSGPARRYRAVLFDRDGTIAYTDEGVYAEAAQWAAQTFGKPAREMGAALQAQWEARAFQWWHLRSRDDEDAFWADYGRELAGRMGVDPARAPEIMAAYPYWRYMKPAPQAREVLSELKSRGLKIGVLSNTLPSVHETLDEIGVGDLIDAAVASCVVGVHKPEAEAYLYAARALDVSPAEVLFVDDLPENVEAARALGMGGLLIDLSGRNPAAIHRLTQVLDEL
jgi:putative hydrolase of the HAD superfamily